MRITIELEVDIDGNLDPSRVKDILLEHGVLCQMIMSENIDGTDEWAIEINSAKIVEVRE